MIFKVLVIGRDLALQTGFLTQVSGRNLSTQLFSTLGISLGIARYDDKEGSSVALQLWAIPQSERLTGLSQSFSKGYRAVIAIIRPNELQELPDLFQSLTLTFDSNTVIGVVGSFEDAVPLCQNLSIQFQEDLQPTMATDASDIINYLAQNLISRERASTQSPKILVLDESVCPLYQPPILSRSETQCSDEEIDAIRNILQDQKLTVVGNECVINIGEGRVSISLRTGSVRLTPDICNLCLHHCKRDANVCIIAIDSGWSSQGISQKALLIAAKAIAIAERRLPHHVESQIQRACFCSKFVLNCDLTAATFNEKPLETRQKQSFVGKSLLEAAEDRVNDGKLPRSAFNMLKRRFLSIEKSNNE